MALRTLALYLLGNREAILQVAATKHALWLGLLFVLSAGFAREYDGEDLLHEPGHLLIPLGASLATCTILFGLLWFVFHGWIVPSAGRKYLQFLTLYWMTAPLAWVYAIPVERLMDPATATGANLWLLAIVAVWRVALMIRVTSILFEAPVVRATLPVLLFADTVLLMLMQIMPRPIIEMMGGVRQTESEQILSVVTTLLIIGGSLTWPFWAIGTVIVLFNNYDRRRTGGEAPNRPAVSEGHVAGTLWGLAAISLVIWIAILPFTQPEQQRRFRAEQHFKNGQIREGLRYLSNHPRSAFPPHWDPPPRIAFSRLRSPNVLDILPVMQEMPKGDISPWVEELYVAKFNDQFVNFFFWRELTDEELERFVEIADRFPDPNTVLPFQDEWLPREVESASRPPALQAKLRAFLEKYEWYRERQRQIREWEAKQKAEADQKEAAEAGKGESD